MSRIEKVRDWVKDIGDHIDAECEVAFIYDTEADAFHSEVQFKDSDLRNGTLRIEFERSDFTPTGYHQFLDQLSEQVNQIKS